MDISSLSLAVLNRFIRARKALAALPLAAAVALALLVPANAALAQQPEPAAMAETSHRATAHHGGEANLVLPDLSNTTNPDSTLSAQYAANQRYSRRSRRNR